MDWTFIANALITIVVTLVASSGFWAVIEKRTQQRNMQTELLIGLAHDKIVYLGMSYIQRGWLYYDEFENLATYLYKPYEKLGGNGSAMRVMEEVRKLPIRNQDVTLPIKENK